MEVVVTKLLIVLFTNQFVLTFAKGFLPGLFDSPSIARLVVLTIPTLGVGVYLTRGKNEIEEQFDFLLIALLAIASGYIGLQPGRPSAWILLPAIAFLGMSWNLSSSTGGVRVLAFGKVVGAGVLGTAWMYVYPEPWNELLNMGGILALALWIVQCLREKFIRVVLQHRRGAS